MPHHKAEHSMKKILTVLIFVCGCFCRHISAQSGRIKTKESPTPTPAPRPNVIYSPTGNIVYPKPQNLPSSPPITNNDDDEITIESALVPIPVSVTDAEGQAVISLKLEDFTLQINGQAAEIGDLGAFGNSGQTCAAFR